ncbi:MAG: glycosyltransferase [Proteobacteria bacterium]|nr:glycosyltransferase [Pseudomonadota bacterium]
MNELRVLQAIAGRPHGGAEEFFVRLAIALQRAGLDQRIVIRRDPARSRRLGTAGLPPLELPFAGAFDLLTRQALAREIRRYRPQVVLTWMSRATRLMPPRWLAGGGYVHAARLGGYYDLKYYRRCEHLVGNTRAIVDFIRGGGVPPARVHYLPNFVDALPVAAVERAALSTPTGVPLVLALGRLHPNKAFDVALDALVHVPGAYLWLAGEGELHGDLERQAMRLGINDRVRFLGWRPDAAALIEACDIVICPSRVEPLGNVVIEAWARRRPVIAAASDGPVALIDDDITGLIVPIDDAESFAAALRRLIADADKRGRLGAAGRAAYEAEFTEAAAVAQYLKFFETVSGSCAASRAS